MPGFVSVIGAGPGDPELLTVKAVRRLESADLLLYDSLIDTTVIALARQAQRFCVGKRARQRTVDQSTINHLMIRGAQRGKRVVQVLHRNNFEELAPDSAAAREITALVDELLRWPT